MATRSSTAAISPSCSRTGHSEPRDATPRIPNIRPAHLATGARAFRCLRRRPVSRGLTPLMLVHRSDDAHETRRLRTRRVAACRSRDRAHGSRIASAMRRRSPPRCRSTQAASSSARPIARARIGPRQRWSWRSAPRPRPPPRGDRTSVRETEDGPVRGLAAGARVCAITEGVSCAPVARPLRSASHTRGGTRPGKAQTPPSHRLRRRLREWAILDSNQ